MQIFLHIILPVLVGSAIGYCTNYIAIRMLFRPHRAIYIGKKQLPFTPGIIPKNQKRLARAIGDAVSDQLITKEAVLGNIEGAGGKYISKIASSMIESDRSISGMLPGSVDTDGLIEKISSAASNAIIRKASGADLDLLVAGIGQDTIGPVLSNNPMLAMLLGESALNALYSKIADSIRNYLNEKGGDAISGAIASYLKEEADKPLTELTAGRIDIDSLTQTLTRLIGKAVADHADELIETLDIRGIVTRRIEEMDMDELEELVLSVMKEELQAVINLGALIGALIGIINIFL